MGEVAYDEPLLLNKEDNQLSYIKKTSLVKSSIKWVLKIVMWVVFVIFAVVVFLFPTEFMTQLYFKWIRATNVTLFGDTASSFLLFTVPILFIAFLGIVYLCISGEEGANDCKLAKKPRFRLWTFPVLVDGPFGVVSAGEMIGIIIFIVYIIWALVVFTIRNYNLLPLFKDLPMSKSSLMLELTGLRFGFLGLICLAFLFLPVARGSIFLRLIDIPFEHATRYHVWLGHLTMLLFTLHGLLYVVAWAMQGRLIQELLGWKNIGVANLPGVISLIAGLLMWVTSLPGVRRVNFELFFYTHQLYVVFILFMALHIGDSVFCMAGAGIFMFMIDRFLRFWQSRTTVDVLSAKCYPCGTLELVLSKPPNLSYNALGWIFLQVRELSWLQWHPFSVSSSPLEGKHRLAIMIKVLGDWTAKLKDQISSISEKTKGDGKITVSVEGPYGHESPYHLTYENLILVAGGIGISPFLAILSDVLHRLKNGMPCLPKNILIVWAVKKSEELPLLKSVDIESICPSFSDKLNLEIQTYVTRESEPPLEEGNISGNFYPSIVPATRGCPMSGLAGTGSLFWSGLYLAVCTIGLVVSVGLVDVYYINPRNITYWWYKGLLLIGTMTASVLVFGGLVIAFWHIWERKTSSKMVSSDGEEVCSLLQQTNGTEKNSSQEQYSNSVIYGKRPDLEGIFGSTSERWGHVDIGVIICGPSTLQTSVAKECRRQNLKRRNNERIPPCFVRKCEQSLHGTIKLQSDDLLFNVEITEHDRQLFLAKG